MPTLQGNYKVPHFDSKGSSDHFFTDAGVPTTFLLTSFYWDNFITFGMGPKPGPDGKLSIALPMGDKKLPGIVAEDIGKSAYGIFKKGKEFIGKKVGIAGQHLTGKQIAESFSKALGKDVSYNAIPPEVYRSFGFPGIVRDVFAECLAEAFGNLLSSQVLTGDAYFFPDNYLFEDSVGGFTNVLSNDAGEFLVSHVQSTAFPSGPGLGPSPKVMKEPQ